MRVTPALLQTIHDAADRTRSANHGASTKHALLGSAIREVTRGLGADDLLSVAAHFREDPEIAVVLLEDVIAAQPNNSRALVRLADCYWLLGAGPQPVAELANRAIAIDPGDRAAWHLWALSESQPRERVGRWQQIAQRFPDDMLALANYADNAASVAAGERDYEMLDAAIAAYEGLRARAQRDDERNAVDTALATLRKWRF